MIFVIWGLRVHFHAIGDGVFHCQRCGGDRKYTRRAGRRFFTLFFIPVIPLNRAGEHIRCAACGTRYHVEVLRLPTAAAMQAALPAGMRAAGTAMLRAGGAAAGQARQRAIDAIRGSGAEGYDGAALDADLALPAGSGSAELGALAGQLTVHAKEWFLAEVVRIGMAGGPLTDAEREAAHWVGAGIGMTQAQAFGVITMTEHAATAE